MPSCLVSVSGRLCVQGCVGPSMCVCVCVCVFVSVRVCLCAGSTPCLAAWLTDTGVPLVPISSTVALTHLPGNTHACRAMHTQAVIHTHSHTHTHTTHPHTHTYTHTQTHTHSHTYTHTLTHTHIHTHSHTMRMPKTQHSIIYSSELSALQDLISSADN